MVRLSRGLLDCPEPARLLGACSHCLAAGILLLHAAVCQAPPLTAVEEGAQPVKPGFGSVWGTVVGEAGHPVAGARVRAIRVPRRTPLVSFEPALDAVTDALGAFEGYLPPDSYTVWVTKGDLTSDTKPRHAMGWRIQAGKELGDQRVVLRPGRRVHGRVTRQVSGKPVAGARLIVDTGHMAVTDTSGRYEIRGVGQGEHPVVVTAHGCALVRRRLPPSIALDHEENFELDPGYTVRGRAIDEAGNPVAGALVSSRFGGCWLHVSLRRCVTDADGRYALPGHSWDEEPPELEISHPDYADDEKEDLHLPTAGNDLDLDLVLTRGFAVEGVVLDPDGEPVPLAQVVPYFHERAAVRTDAAGRFRIGKIPRGMQGVLMVVPYTFAPAYQVFRPGKGADVPQLTLRVEKGWRATGRVVDSDGKPVVGASVSPRMLIREGRGERWEEFGSGARTDERGRFGLRNMPASGVVVDVSRLGWESVRERPLEKDGENVIVLERLGVVVGEVTDAATGRPVKAFTVKLSRPGGSSRGGGDFVSDDGQFTVPRVSTGTSVTLTVAAEGYVPTRLNRVLAHPRDWEGWPVAIKLGQGRALRGAVRDAETRDPIVGAEIAFFGSDWDSESWYGLSIELLDRPHRGPQKVVRKTTTGADGRFELHVGEGMPYTMLVARHADYAPTLLHDPAFDEDNNFTLARPAALSGSLKTVPGLDVAKAALTVWINDLTFGGRQRIGPDGSVHITNLPPGLARLWVFGGKKDHPKGVPTRVADIVLESGKTAILDFSKLESHVLHGRVALGGSPVEDAVVSVHGVGPGLLRVPLGVARTAADGCYRIVNLPATELTAFVQRGEHSAPNALVRNQLPVDLREGDADLDVEFHTCRIEGRLVSAEDGSPISGEYGSAWRMLNGAEPPSLCLEAIGGSGARQLSFFVGRIRGRGAKRLGLRAARQIGVRVAEQAYEKSDREGRFEIRHLSPGRYRVRYKDGGLELPLLTPEFSLDRDGETHQITVRVPASAPLALRVVSQPTGEPIPNATLSIFTSDGVFLAAGRFVPRKEAREVPDRTLVLPPYESLTTDGEGLWGLKSVPQATYGAWVVAPGYAATWVAPVETGVTPTRIALPPAARLEFVPDTGLFANQKLAYVVYRLHRPDDSIAFPAGQLCPTAALPDTGAAALTPGRACRIDSLEPGPRRVEWAVYPFIPDPFLSWVLPTRAYEPMATGSASVTLSAGATCTVPLAKPQTAGE